MKMNDIINEVEDNFGLSPEQRKLANYGRILMDQATTTKDDALSNVMAVVGDSLTNFGAIVSAEVIKKLLNHADNIATTQSKLKSDHADSGLDDLDTDDNDFNEPDDDAMAAQADQAARAKRD